MGMGRLSEGCGSCLMEMWMLSGGCGEVVLWVCGGSLECDGVCLEGGGRLSGGNGWTALRVWELYCGYVEAV